MRHLKSGRGLGVNPSHRIALLRSLTLALIEHDAIRTTRARAKELRWYGERVVTLAKRGDVAARRHIIKLLGSAQTSVPGENRVRNAVARFDQVTDVSDEDRTLAFANIKKAAEHYDVELTETSWRDLGVHPQAHRKEAAAKAVKTKRERGEL